MIYPEISLRRACLVGVRGVGKTTLIRSVIERLPHVEFVVGSAILRELAGSDFVRFDHLPPDVKLAYRESAVQWMENRQAVNGKHILCDGHTSLLDESTGRVSAVFTESDCRFFRELIILEASADIVFMRRRNDLSKRRALDFALIEEELAGERETSLRIAHDWGMVLHELPGSGDSTTALALENILR